MNVKKVSRRMNNTKKAFIKWLKDSGADNIYHYYPKRSSDWDYYATVSGFIDYRYYTSTFMVFKGKEYLDYRDGENSYSKISIDEFMQLVR